jgi:hypothetical protein
VALGGIPVIRIQRRTVPRRRDKHADKEESS